MIANALIAFVEFHLDGRTETSGGSLHTKPIWEEVHDGNITP